MLMQSEILEAAKLKLKEIISIPVYLDEVKENYETPCFFLKLVKHTRPDNEAANRYYNECLLGIAYFEQKGTVKASIFYDIQDAIIRKFWRGLKVGKRHIHFQELECDIVGQDGDIMSVALPFSYFDADEDDDLTRLDLIRRINVDGRFKGDQELKIRIGDDMNGEIENADS